MMACHRTNVVVTGTPISGFGSWAGGSSEWDWGWEFLRG